MKKKNLNLDSLKVESFVTDLEQEISNTVKGGTADPTFHNSNCCDSRYICPQTIFAECHTLDGECITVVQNYCNKK